MSRAFVKESDAPEELPELPVSEHRNLVTRRGLRLIEETVTSLHAALKTEPKDNTPTIARLERDLRYWSARRASAELVPPTDDTAQVRFGLKVTLEKDDGTRVAYRIVGQDEADPAQGLLSYVSPLARALLGKAVGDTVHIGEHEAEVVGIDA